MRLLRIAVVVLLAVLVLFVGGCAVYGLGSTGEGNPADLLTTPTETAP